MVKLSIDVTSMGDACVGRHENLSNKERLIVINNPDPDYKSSLQSFLQHCECAYKNSSLVWKWFFLVYTTKEKNWLFKKWNYPCLSLTGPATTPRTRAGKWAMEKHGKFHWSETKYNLCCPIEDFYFLFQILLRYNLSKRTWIWNML